MSGVVNFFSSALQRQNRPVKKTDNAFKSSNALVGGRLPEMRDEVLFGSTGKGAKTSDTLKFGLRFPSKPNSKPRTLSDLSGARLNSSSNQPNFNVGLSPKVRNWGLGITAGLTLAGLGGAFIPKYIMNEAIATCADASMENVEYGGGISPAQRIENLRAMANTAWGEGKDLNKVDWNAILTLLATSDDLLNEVDPEDKEHVERVKAFQAEMNEIRETVLEQAITDNNGSKLIGANLIPINVIQEALYTSGIYGSLSGDAAVQERLSSLTAPYSTHVLFVTPNPEDRKNKPPVYEFLTPAEAEEKTTADSYVIDLRYPAWVAQARMGSQDAVDALIGQFNDILATYEKPESYNYAGAEAPPPHPIFEVMQILTEVPASATTPELDQMMLELVFEDSSVMSPTLVEVDEQKDRDHYTIVAYAINILSKRNHPMAATAALQWFQNNTGNIVTNEPDMLVMEVIARKAQESQKDFEILLQVMATHPDTAIQALYGVFEDRTDSDRDPIYDHGPLRNAHLAMVDALKAHPEEVHKLILDLFNDEAARLPGAKRSAETKMDTALGIFMMASDYSGQYTDILRNIVRDKSQAYPIAMLGLGITQDKESIPYLMDMAVDENAAIGDRAQALETVIQIIGPSRIPEEHKAKVAEEGIFSDYVLRTHLDNFMSTSTMRVDSKGNLKFNTFNMSWGVRAMNEFNTWLEQEQKVRTVDGLLINEKALELLDKYLGTGNGATFRTLAQDPEFQRKYLAKMNAYLTGEGKNMDLSLAYPMMALLQASGDASAVPTFVEIAKYAEHYGPDMTKIPCGGPELQAQLAQILKARAIDGMGGTLSPTDPNVKLLHLVAKYDQDLTIQREGIKALATMGDRMLAGRDLETNPLTKEEEAALSLHIDKLFEIQVEVEDGEFLSKHQMRRTQDILRYEIALAIDALGGRDELLKRSDKLWKDYHQTLVTPGNVADIAKNDPELVGIRTLRSYIQAMMARGLTPEAAEAKGFDPEMIAYFGDESYWLGDFTDQCGNEITGGQHANFDVGFAHNGFSGESHPYPYNQPMNLVYPEGTDFARTDNWEVPHSSATAAQISKIANGPEILTFHVNGEVPWDPSRSAAYQNAFMVYIEQLVQQQAAGETNVITANYSIGYNKLVYYMENYREQMVDVISAYMQALGETGVTNVVSAGNSQGGDFLEQFNPVGSQTGLGSRLTDDLKVIKLPSTIVSSAVDGLALWLAEFSSMPNPLRLEDALPMFGAPGYRIPLPLYGEADGTSFSAPNTTGIIHRSKMIRAALGLPPLTHEQWEKALTYASEPLPEREEKFTGRYINPLLLFQQIIQKEPAPIQSSEEKKPVEK